MTTAAPPDVRAEACPMCGRRPNSHLRAALAAATAKQVAMSRPWNETNPEWWKAQVEWRGDLAWEWLVNEWNADFHVFAARLAKETP